MDGVTSRLQSGQLSPLCQYSGPGHQAPFVRATKEKVGDGLAVATVDALLEDGNLDVAVVGRAFLQNPGRRARGPHALAAQPDALGLQRAGEEVCGGQ